MIATLRFLSGALLGAARRSASRLSLFALLLGAPYLALAQRLFTSDANVRNVKAFFSLHRAKFKPQVLLAS